MHFAARLAALELAQDSAKRYVGPIGYATEEGLSRPGITFFLGFALDIDHWTLELDTGRRFRGQQHKARHGVGHPILLWLFFLIMSASTPAGPSKGSKAKGPSFPGEKVQIKRQPTHFTSTGPYAGSKLHPRATVLPITPGPPGETAMQRVVRLRAAVTAARKAQETWQDRWFDRGRWFADKSHRITVGVLMAFSGGSFLQNAWTVKGADTGCFQQEC
jgi:hypothetical protein